jgi:adenosylmethionine-8-amino-7-oxononanoate aminotransferase
MANTPKIVRLKHQPKEVREALQKQYRGLNYYRFDRATKEELLKLGYNISGWVDDPFKQSR